MRWQRQLSARGADALDPSTGGHVHAPHERQHAPDTRRTGSEIIVAVAANRTISGHDDAHLRKPLCIPWAGPRLGIKPGTAQLEMAEEEELTDAATFRLDTVDIALGSGWQVESMRHTDEFNREEVTITVQYSSDDHISSIARWCPDREGEVFYQDSAGKTTGSGHG